jgi:hypothetical protein
MRGARAWTTFSLSSTVGALARDAQCPGDLPGNGVVDVDDLLMVINNWGRAFQGNQAGSDFAVQLDTLKRVDMIGA